MRGLRYVACRGSHLHRRRTAPQSRNVGGTSGKTKFCAGHQHPIHSQHVRAVHGLFGRNCGGRPLFASRGSPRVADPNRTVRARADLVLGRIPQTSLFARLRLWDHLLPDRCNLYLVCAAHFCSASAYRCSNQLCTSSIAEYAASSRPPTHSRNMRTSQTKDHRGCAAILGRLCSTKTCPVHAKT